MTLIFSLIIFNLGFLAGIWWATRSARQRSNDASLPRTSHPGQLVTPRAPAFAIDPVVSKN
jgi:hypothetical protein